MEKKPIVLVGLMGAGKTSIGRALARKLKIPFVDLDQEIEVISGCSISDIFASYGEKDFRRIEERVFERVMGEEPKYKIISTGEGAFITPKVRHLALANSTTVWLKADLPLLKKRTSFRSTRPQLMAGEPGEILSKLMAEQYPVYANAEIVIDTADEPLAKTLAKVVKALDKAKS